jgi:hypothetical protein
MALMFSIIQPHTTQITPTHILQEKVRNLKMKAEWS